MVSPHIRRATRCNFALSPEVQLLAALRFYAVGSFLEVVGDGTGLSKASVSRSVAAVTSILLHHARAHIQLPTTREEIRQAVVDPEGLITDIVARWPGGTHDSYVFVNSAVGQKAAREEFGWSFLLGDSGYPLRSYLVTPLTNLATPAEERFNEAHTDTRTHIKRMFGRWKSRFRCIHCSSGGLRLSPTKSCGVIVVTAMLHNMAVRAGADEPPPLDEDEDSEDDDAPPLVPGPPNDARAALHQAGVHRRQELIDLFF
ncbi:putative nuclease HARBI1 [Cololabis saira]|uniref:putative nuclease HARBI1 n=1 Tax=Cololabis saira TaxID=129043 RepID=UPI002AD4FDBD|nr:putative nuclease HARBI1 [Cololabis saira]